jgi:hypothetical protein
MEISCLSTSDSTTDRPISEDKANSNISGDEITFVKTSSEERELLYPGLAGTWKILDIKV